MIIDRRGPAARDSDAMPVYPDAAPDSADRDDRVRFALDKANAGAADFSESLDAVPGRARGASGRAQSLRLG
jgi:hypothetical protein